MKTLKPRTGNADLAEALLQAEVCQTLCALLKRFHLQRGTAGPAAAEDERQQVHLLVWGRTVRDDRVAIVSCFTCLLV